MRLHVILDFVKYLVNVILYHENHNMFPQQ